MTEITEPGVYDLPADVYHADPVPGGSLSSSGARKLLPPSCPALYAYEREHPTLPTKALDLGTAAHALVLGKGTIPAVVNHENYRSKAAQAERDAIRAVGGVPILPSEYEQIKAMAEALRGHPLAAGLLARGYGQPEHAVFWRDRPTGIMRRALLDWLPARDRARPVIADYKTARSASPRAVARAVAEHGYHRQAAWYLDALAAIGYPPDTAFVFIFQEKTPPYLVTLAELDAPALRAGRASNRRAIEVFAECQSTGRWPGYSDGIEEVALPVWAREEELS